MTAAILPARTESAPRSGPTVRSSRMVSGAGRAPARSSSAKSVVCCTVKLPLMMPRPPVMALRITGALITLPSRMMAKGRPTFFEVASPNLRAPTESKLKATTGWLSWKLGWASIRCSPLTMMRRFTTYCTGRPLASTSSSAS